jgi:hypothetical protein
VEYGMFIWFFLRKKSTKKMGLDWLTMGKPIGNDWIEEAGYYMK